MNNSAREQTDDSLRLEREKVDQALEAELAALDATADAVITLARERADAVLRAARAKTPSHSPVIARQRLREDQALQSERSDADETLREERAEQVAHLTAERAETDHDLLSERTRADSALAMRDEFLGVVSHDLRNMLTAMVGSAGLIALSVEGESHLQNVLRHAQSIERSAARMNRLIGDLVDVASIEAGALALAREIGDPTPVVTEAVDAFQTQATLSGITLVSELPPLGVAAFDPARILQVLCNLVSNALKFTPAPGIVTVRVNRRETELQFSVSDTGIGIPADKLQAVFVRFLQLGANDRRGVGLGLYISKSIVQGHGGRIWAESRLGEGTVFHFTLPVQALS